ncbi:MAG: TIGR02147 family protein [Chitinivibrionales bacterium]|nr:TIGR02147 family protein [Chitinivibrionales bacterium]
MSVIISGKGRSRVMPDIYQYTEYRKFLADYFKEQKDSNPSFSHQYFARKASIKSSGFVLHVIKGERNLTKPVLLNIARAIGLDPAQTDYFEDLVSFDQAKTQSDREYYFGRIAAKRRLLKISSLADRQYEYYSEWYHPVIRELITLDANVDCADLAKRLVPPIMPKQAKNSLELQEKLGILKKDEFGKYRQAKPFISGGSAERNTALVKYQKEMLEHTKSAWDRFSTDEMTMHTATLCMSEDLIDTVREEIRTFKKRLLDLIGNDKKLPDRVFHLNINLFPMTKSTKGKK